MTLLGNITLALACFRLAVSNGWTLEELDPRLLIDEGTRRPNVLLISLLIMLFNFLKMNFSLLVRQSFKTSSPLLLFPRPPLLAFDLPLKHLVSSQIGARPAVLKPLQWRISGAIMRWQGVPQR